jgi:two-component system response regulator ChvI
MATLASLEEAAMTTVAIVNNEDRTRAIIRRILREAGYHVREYHDTESALELCEYPADLAILDRTNAPLKGPELFVRIRAHTAMPIMFVSGNGYILEKELAQLKVQPEAVIDLPFDNSEFLDVVRRVLP